MDLGPKGKVALVAASSKGLGRACASSLAAEGARVVMCARNLPELERAAGEIRDATGAEIVAVAADVSRAEDITNLFASAETRFGPVDVLVINAGGPPPVPLDDLSDKHWLDAFELTHLSAVRM